MVLNGDGESEFRVSCIDIEGFRRERELSEMEGDNDDLDGGVDGETGLTKLGQDEKGRSGDIDGTESGVELGGVVILICEGVDFL